MPNTDTPGSANFARQAQQLINKTTANFTGKQRGRDHGEGRRVPRRHSYEINDPKAKPWSKVGDGSIRQGVIHCETLVATADELRHHLRKQYPAAEVRRRQRERDSLAAELADINTRSPAEIPVGRPASLRMAIDKLDEWLDLADGRLRRIDLDVLRALLTFLEFSTGKLFPAQDTIAERAGCHENSVKSALKRLRLHGLIDWVRRTIRTGNEGEFAPQLEQTSNAYEIAPRAKMAVRTWQRYWQRLRVRLARLGALPASVPRPEPGIATDPGLRAALDGLGSSIRSAST